MAKRTLEQLEVGIERCRRCQCYGKCPGFRQSGKQIRVGVVGLGEGNIPLAAPVPVKWRGHSNPKPMTRLP